MKRKILTILACLLMVINVFALPACTNSDLEAKIAELETKIEQLEQEKQELEELVQDLEEQLEQFDVSAIVEQEVGNMVELSYWFFTSGVPNNRITLHSSIENAVFECVVDKGNFWWNNEYIKQAVVSSGETVYWYDNRENIHTVFVDIALKLDDINVGYAVIKIIEQDNGEFEATVLKSAIFPKVDGEYQRVTKEQVNSLIRDVKK